MHRYLTDAMQVVTKAVVVALGLPYLIVIAANTYYGWPSSRGEEKYKTLHPTRVYKLNYVVLEQLTLLKWFPLWLKWNQFYRSSDTVTKVIYDIYSLSKSSYSILIHVNTTYLAMA